MNGSNVLYQGVFWRKACITNIAVERFLYFMNYCYVPIPSLLTNVKLESKMASFLHELMLYDCSNLSFFVNLASQTSHLKSFFTSCCLVSIQVSFSWKIAITNITLETFLSFMKCCYVLIQFFLSLKTSITHAALERLLSFMNWWNLSIQRGLLCKTCIANVAFERLPSFMN